MNPLYQLYSEHSQLVGLPVPERCEDWPWQTCPDCHQLAGQLHTPMEPRR